ncbi:DUF2059 domain-containing protein [Parasphingopyxis sp. CP4]|uniref:DUF2059 domain-containing protein n=1 Tax=Parasphingopyxis sp. CP4 TaxID=2724527 RepID=UPI0015A0745F|nr:DUF2059 domain-containing protein [Parasphingopyxis sp. CP4]QLC22081.1 DUF2059 domain-containing protein [Parasphingopyxis sp. CP4]
MKINITLAFATAAVIGASPATAQAQTIVSQTAAPPTQPAYAEPEPERIEAARELLEILMPASQREAMIISMIEPMMANLEAGVLQSPELQSAFTDTPGAEALFREFLVSQRSSELALARNSLPTMMEAMARAYARRFTRREMRDIGDFFESGPGQTYLAQSTTIMADPDIAAWQRQVMAQSMQHLQTELPALMTRLSELQNGAPTAPAANRSVTNSNLDAMRGGGNQTTDAEPDTEE